MSTSSQSHWTDSGCTELCHTLCLFVVEACKTNGEPYPPKTVFHLLVGLLRYARSGSVPLYSSTNAENKERCHVYLLDLYMEKVPKDALSKGAFYLRPIATVSDISGGGWYISIPAGKHMLQKMLPIMCEEAGIAR